VDNLALHAITASQDANNVAQQALDSDRRQYALAVKNQQDATMPAVVIQFKGPANQAIITARTITNGRELFSRISGTTYAKVRFRWSAYVQRHVYDAATMDLRAGVDTGGSGPVNDALLRRLFSRASESSQQSDLLLPDDRHYRTVP
jgi:hypothetical protein